MSRTLFLFQPHSIVDIITNSSSELYIFEGKNKNIIEKMIEKVYPEYLTEYAPLISMDEISVDDLDSYISRVCHGWGDDPNDFPLIGDYTFDELYEITNRYGQLRYELKDNTRPPKEKKVKKFDEFNKDIDPYGEENWEGNDEDDGIWHYRQFVTEKNIEEVKDRIDPKRRMYFMYSLDENPDWDYQEKLMEIGTRLHLG